MLKLTNVCSAYDTVNVLFDVNMEVNQGEIVSLIGANGAGKSTLLLTVSGIVQAKSGTITFEGRDITRVPPHSIARMGIAHIPEGRRVFPGLTVWENLEVGSSPLNLTKKQLDDKIDSIFDRFPRLRERRQQLAWSLSGGEQQMLAIGRGLMSNPRLLILDEPSLGLAPLLVNEVFEIVKEIRDTGTTVFLVEQNAYMALTISDQAYVMSSGSIVLHGPASQLLENDDVRRVYLSIH